MFLLYTYIKKFSSSLNGNVPKVLFSQLNGRIAVVIILASLFSGYYLGQLDFWDQLKSFLWLWYNLSFIVSAWITWEMSTHALKHKGYANLLWFAVPVMSVIGTDLFFRFVFIRSLMLMVLVMAALSAIWQTYQTFKTSPKSNQER